MTARLHRRGQAAVLAVLLAGPARAGQPAAPPAQAAQPVFKTGTTIVEVDVTVTDREGRFVADLTRDDFEVLEDGRPQEIVRLYVVTGRTARDIPGRAPAPAAAGEPGAGPPPVAPRRVFVLFFDVEHLQAGAFKRLQDAAVTFLSQEFQPEDIGGVVMGSTMVGNRLTTDREALVTAVRQATPRGDKTARRAELLEWPRLSSDAEAVRIALADDRDVLDQVVRRACQDDPSACRWADPTPMVLEKARRIVAELRPAARRTVMALQALASGLARLPGRKTIFLLTEGFFVEESWADLRQIVGAAARANVRIYSLDARGLDARPANDPRQLSAMDSGGGVPLDAYNTLEDGPNALAVDTGGYPIRHTNKFAEAMAEIARDASHYYVIAYSPTNAAMDASFRAITVRVARAGVRVRARRGYVASPPARSGAPPDSSPAGSAGAAPRPVEAATAARPAPAATPPVPAPPTVADTTAAPAGSAPGVHLRPDLSVRVAELAERGSEDAASGGSLAREGWDHYAKGDLEGAEPRLERAVAQPGAAPWAWYVLGFTKLGLHKPGEAARAWERVRAAVPEFQAVYLDLADAYLQLGDAARALETLRAAEMRWPDEPEVLNALGTVQVRRGSLDEAIATFERAVAARPADALASLNAARTYELRYYKMRRWVAAWARWVDNPDDLAKAIAHYERYLAIGGPYADEARAAVERLRWVR